MSGEKKTNANQIPSAGPCINCGQVPGEPVRCKSCAKAHAQVLLATVYRKVIERYDSEMNIARKLRCKERKAS